jgi:PKD repeat protein
LIEFKDLSSGSPEKWEWNMIGGPIVHTTGRKVVLTEQDPYYDFPTPGTYPVILTIVKGNIGVGMGKKDVVVIKNHLEPNVIIPDSRTLLSKNAGIRYQWLRDGEVLPGAVSRTYEFNGLPGAYQVAAYDEVCNTLSDPFIITGLEEEIRGQVALSPNPSSGEFTITGVSENAVVSMVTGVGREIELASTGRGRYSVKSFANGLYIIRIVDSGQVSFLKLLLER